jgi:translation initiation factor IF-2
MKQKDLQKDSNGQDLEIYGEAIVSQIFHVTEDGPKKGSPKRHIQVAGCRVQDGHVLMDHKYRIIRNDICIIEDLKPHSLKRFKKDVGKVEKGMECGIAFEGLKSGFSL